MACGRFNLSQYSGAAGRQLGSLAPGGKIVFSIELLMTTSRRALKDPGNLVGLCWEQIVTASLQGAGIALLHYPIKQVEDESAQISRAKM